MNTQPTVLVSVSTTGVATLTLNRAEKSNAFDPNMITALLTALDQLKTRDNIRCLILNANGKHFSSGADLNWMKSMALKTEAENKQDASQLAALLERLYRFPAPTIAVVQGAAFGGALGLICCCDITIASPQAKFCLSEAKLGLVPATIAPYVCRAMGVRQAQRYMLTTELITATMAQTSGIVHFVSDDITLQTQHIINSLLNNSPNALHTIKQLCQQCENNPIDQTLINYTSDLIAHIRCTPEAQEGIQAFFEQSQPSWSIRHDNKDH